MKLERSTVKSLLFVGVHVPIFVVFVGRLIHEIKNPTNNETWEAARHRYNGKCCPRVTSTFWDKLHRVQLTILMTK
jgi:hypothetical protein